MLRCGLETTTSTALDGNDPPIYELGSVRRESSSGLGKGGAVYMPVPVCAPPSLPPLQILLRSLLTMKMKSIE